MTKRSIPRDPDAYQIARDMPLFDTGAESAQNDNLDRGGSPTGMGGAPNRGPNIGETRTDRSAPTPPRRDPSFQPQPMSRRDDPDTSKAAAGCVLGHVTRLQWRVYLAYFVHGPMTAKECEALPAFDDLGFSTVRKRASELVAQGLLEDTGERRDRCAVLRVKP